MNKQEFIETFSILINDFKIEFKKEIKEEIRQEFKEFKEEIRQEIKEFKEEIREEIKDMKDDIKKMKNDISITKDIFNKYIKTDATGIENEIGYTFKKYYLNNISQKSQIKKFNLKKIFDCDNKIITDIDFSYIIYSSNDTNIIKEVSFVIIEAKHKITKEKIIKKLQQIHLIRELIDKINNNTCNKNNTLVKELNKNQIKLNSNKILFYIGGPNWDDDASQFVKSINKIENTQSISNIISKVKKSIKIKEDDFSNILYFMKDKIGIIEPSGDKYIVIDESTQAGGKVCLYKKSHIC
tara:strand:- start:8922 stop:9812 length:891 start_codon:yes stop_codon:yes gene_type:complete